MKYDDDDVQSILNRGGAVFEAGVEKVIYWLAKDLQDARKELEEAKKDSVWCDAPDYANEAVVYYKNDNTGYYSSENRIICKRTLPKTPKQELIDKFAEKNTLAMKCANLSKEILEAFAKEYEEVMRK